MSLCGECLPEGNEKPTTLSPASILLNGYSPGNVDQEIRRSSIEADIVDLRRRMGEIVTDENGDMVDGTPHDGSVLSVLERVATASNTSDNEEGDECGETRSEIPTESDASDFDRINKIDLNDLPADVVSVLREALNGIACDDGADADECPEKSYHIPE